MARKPKIADTTGEKQGSAPKKKPRGKPFTKGVSGNPAGRPKGSRNKISEAFIHAMAEDFDAYGVDAIRRVREDKPDVYLRIVADLVPKELDVKHDGSIAFSNLWQLVGQGKAEGVVA